MLTYDAAAAEQPEGKAVGQGAGVEALASVGAADWSYWLALWAICALTQGFSHLPAELFTHPRRALPFLP